MLDMQQKLSLIKESDILLFRAPTCICSIGWWIAQFTSSIYSHVGIATLKPSGVDCLEFREFKGSRIKDLRDYISEDRVTIDVFRIINKFEFEENNEYKTLVFSDTVAKQITNQAKTMIGQHYGWGNIWRIMKTYIPFLRLFVHKFGTEKVDQYVCSTFVSYLFRTNYIDPCPFLRDVYTTPGDLARSPLFMYQFSL